ncbi:hypothetical protein [Streptomyces sp. cg36]|uniref:hypothetical protein n=1 Tax=Streptomyces sp. cg36 TaxID=3238798 RepID=UPI0034E21FB2
MTNRRTAKRRPPAGTASVPPRTSDAADRQAEDLIAAARTEAAALTADAEQVLADADRQAAALRKQAEADLAEAHSALADVEERRALAVRDLEQSRRRAGVVRDETEEFLTQHRALADRVHRDAIEAAARTRTAAAHDARTVGERAAADATQMRRSAEACVSEARQLRDQAAQESARIVAAAHRQAKLIRYDADAVRHQAEAEFERARAAHEAVRGRLRMRWASWLWGKAPWAALCAAVGLTASGEYELAHLVGWPGAVAALLPVTIDVWAVTAFHRGRDVRAALAMMIGTNAVYHLAERGLFGVDGAGRPAWWLIILTASIAPVVVWRVHELIGDESADALAAALPVAPSGAASQSPTVPPPVAPSGRPTPPKSRAPTRPSRRGSGPRAAKPSAKASDAELIESALTRLAGGQEPSATWLMSAHGIGATRAARIRDAAKVHTLNSQEGNVS